MSNLPASPQLRMGGTEWALLIALSVLWGSSFFFFKVLVEVVPPLTVVLGRVGIAAIALNVFLLARGDPLPTGIRPWGSFAIMGLLNNVIPFTLIVFGETRISSGLASILNATTPVFTVLVAHVVTTNERLTGQRGAGVLFGFIGAVILIGPRAFLDLAGEDILGEIACLAAALSYAVAGLYGRRFRALPPLTVATGQITASTIITLPLATIVDRPWTLPALGPEIWAAFFGIALLCTALAYGLYFRILAVAGATNLLLVTFLLPISALVLGWLTLGESIETNAIFGMLTVGLGLACIDGRPLAALRRRWIGPGHV